MQLTSSKTKKVLFCHCGNSPVKNQREWPSRPSAGMLHLMMTKETCNTVTCRVLPRILRLRKTFRVVEGHEFSRGPGACPLGIF